MKVFTKKQIVFLLICFVMLQGTCSVSAANEENTSKSDNFIIGIESPYFFNGISGTQYIFFGRPTCLECVTFEPHLTSYLDRSGWVVYYFNTAYWKDNPRYDQILEQYHVTAVPALVKTMNGEFRDLYQFDPDAGEEDIQTQLDAFFGGSKSKLFPVTSQSNFPVQFHDYLLTLTFFLMCFNVGYLMCKRKAIISTQLSPLLWTAINATLIMILHFTVASIGFGFALYYEAAPATDLFAKIGTYTWLIITPLLYFVLLGQCLTIKIKRDARAKATEE